MPLQEDYQVSLANFQGPMDLLLYLIRRAEIDIHDIPIATVTEQYLEFLQNVEEVDVDVAGEFLVMAATLVEIKSRTLMPIERRGRHDDDDDDEAADPRYELVQQLLAYQAYRIASEDLDHRRLEFAQRYPARLAGAQRRQLEDEPAELDLEDLHVLDLSESYERIAEAIDFARLGDHTIEADDTPIALHREDLLDQLQRNARHRISLLDAFEGRPHGQRIGLFIAMLELVRMRHIVVKQDDMDADIVVELNEDPQAEPLTFEEAFAVGHADDNSADVDAGEGETADVDAL